MLTIDDSYRLLNFISNFNKSLVVVLLGFFVIS